VSELSPQQWEEVEKLFARALELTPDERGAFLERECRTEDVRREVVSLLQHAGSEPLISAPAIAAAAASVWETNPDERLIGARLGSYRLQSIAGYGGMGAVYRAYRDDDEFQQLVAIKLVRAAAESRSAQQRFRQERQILASLSHPNIARLLDGGSTPENVPYLVMEFIEGEPITKWCEQQALTIEQRVRLFLPVCAGVEAANRERVIHRDLKPANILVTREGVPKLLDFGIAKLLDEDPRDPGFTATRSQVMTPEYASPEQVRGGRVTAATDVYSLGLVLYEILTSQKAQSIPEHTPHTIVKVVCHAEPLPPAIVKSQLSGDLDNIIRKAIRKEPERRYSSAADLGSDLTRYLDGRPVLARPDTLTYRAAKFLRRNRASVKTSLLSAMCVLAALALLNWLRGPSRIPRVLQVEQITQSGHVEIGGRIVAVGSNLLFTERNGGRWSLAQVPASGGTPLPWPVPLSDPNIMGISPDRERLLVAADPTFGENRALWIVPIATRSPRRLGKVEAYTASWSRDGHRVFYEDGPGLFVVDDDGSNQRKLADVPDRPYGIREAPSPQADLLRFSLFKKDMRPSSLWEIRSDGRGLHRVLPVQEPGQGWPDGDFAGEWTPSGRYYVYHSRSGDAYLFWALRESRGLFPLFYPRPVQIYSTPLTIYWATPSPNGRRVYFATGQERRDLVRFDPAHGQFMPFLSGVSGRHVSYSSDGKQIAYTTVPQDILWRSRSDGGGRLQLTPSTMRAFRPSWSPDGSLIIFYGKRPGQPSRIYVVPADGGKPDPIEAGAVASDASWSPDGKSILFAGVTLGDAGNFRLYIMDWRSRKYAAVPGSDDLAYGAWSPDGRYIAATGSVPGIRLFDTGTQQWSQLADGPLLGSPFWSHDGRYVYFQNSSTSEDQPIFRVRVNGRKLENLMSSRQLPQSDVTGYSLCALTPDDAPVANVIRTNSDIYALDVDLP
jgi:serine/threonine protein kinase/Tol biopolymer transport system component